MRTEGIRVPSTEAEGERSVKSQQSSGAFSASRRRLLNPLVAIPAAWAAATAAIGGLPTLGASAAASRPAPHGTSATRCGRCGAADHGMLDPKCPAAPRVA